MVAPRPKDIHCCCRGSMLQGVAIINRLIIYLRCFTLSIYDLKGVCSILCYVLKSHINETSVSKTSRLLENLSYWTLIAGLFLKLFF